MAIMLIAGVAATADAAPITAAPPPDNSVACIYQKVAGADIMTSLRLDARNGQNPTPAESAADARVTEAAQGCASLHHWSRKRAVAAFFYAGGWAGLEESQQKLRDYGVDPGFLERFAATLTPAQREPIARGEFELGPAVYRALAQSGFRMRSDSEAERERLRVIIGNGLAGVVLRDQGLADFGASGS